MSGIAQAARNTPPSHEVAVFAGRFPIGHHAESKSLNVVSGQMSSSADGKSLHLLIIRRRQIRQLGNIKTIFEEQSERSDA